MARKTKQDAAKAKEAKQKKIAIGGAVLLAGLLAFQAPKVMKMMNQQPKPPIVSATGTATPTPGDTAAPATGTPVVDPNSVAAPTLSGTPTVTTTEAASSDLVDAVPVTADAGQLDTFERFATKDPFAAQADTSSTAVGSSKPAPESPSSSKGGGASGGGDTQKAVTVKPVPSTPTETTSGGATAVPPPSNAVISLNGELMSVAVETDFPQSGVVFNRVGAMFHLLSLTAKSAKISINGGSYASGAQAITLHVGEPLTLQNTADGTKYVLILQKHGTPAPASSAPAAAPAASAPTSTTSSGSVVPSSGG